MKTTGGKALAAGAAIALGLLATSCGERPPATAAGEAQGKTVSDKQTVSDGKEKGAKMEVQLTEANFEAEVLKADRPVLVDFWATWCGPCRMLAPELAALAEERSATLKVGKVNVDEAPELAAKYGISSIPALLLFRNGKLEATAVGYRPKAEIAAFVDKGAAQ